MSGFLFDPFLYDDKGVFMSNTYSVSMRPIPCPIELKKPRMKCGASYYTMWIDKLLALTYFFVNTASISSKVLPLVSGINFQTNQMIITMNPENRK